MTGISGSDLRDWRRSRGWDVPELARQLRRAASDPIAAHDALVRMIRAWERGDHRPSERYELLYRKLGLIPPTDNDQPGAQPAHSASREDDDPVRRRTFVELTAISAAAALLPAPAAPRPALDTEPLALALTAQMTGTAPEPTQEPPGIPTLTLSVTRARAHYQACRYAELITRLPRLLAQLDAACDSLDGDDKLRAYTLAADAYHLAAGMLLKTGDHGLAHLATDRSMTAALASQDPLTVGASARIVTHTLASSGHLPAAIATARTTACGWTARPGRTPRSPCRCTARCCCAAPSPPPSTTTAPPPTRCSPKPPTPPAASAPTRTCAAPPSARSTRRCTRSTSPSPSATPEPPSTWPARSTPPRSPSPNARPACSSTSPRRSSSGASTARPAPRSAPPSRPPRRKLAARAPVRTLARNLAALAPPGTRRDAAHLADRIGAYT